jgi:hypothetical protein
LVVAVYTGIMSRTVAILHELNLQNENVTANEWIRFVHDV